MFFSSPVFWNIISICLILSTKISAPHEQKQKYIQKNWNVYISSHSSFSEEVTYRWIYNEFPVFLHTDRRRFVSQKTGNLYISKVEAQDAGNYSCFVSSPILGKSVYSKYIPLIPLPPDDGE